MESKKNLTIVFYNRIIPLLRLLISANKYLTIDREDKIMEYSMTFDQRRNYMKYVAAWINCTHFGIISSRVDRINDVLNYLVRLGVADLIPYLLINEKTNAFVYEADLERKNIIKVVEIYQDWNPRSIEWRKRNAQFALQLDDDLIDGLDDDVAVTQLVVPFGETALEEVLLYN